MILSCKTLSFASFTQDRTALMYAAQYGYTEMVTSLLASINDKDKSVSFKKRAATFFFGNIYSVDLGAESVFVLLFCCFVLLPLIISLCALTKRKHINGSGKKYRILHLARISKNHFRIEKHYPHADKHVQ